MAAIDTRKLLVREFFDTLSSGDLEALRPLLHPDASWEATGKSIPGGWVAAETEGVGMLACGKEYHNRYAWIIEIRDDKVFALREYMDTHYILTQLDML